jgi:oxidase EvaA
MTINKQNTSQQEKELLFLRSALTLKNKFNSISEIDNWLIKRNEEVFVELNRIKFSEMKNWNFKDDFSKISHSSGKFFSIEGINVNTNWGKISNWDQPIINQPEIGILGIITKVFDGVLYFLLQAKIEPGNVNNVQLSPTLQATKSNYTQVHHGKKPTYLEYFLDRNKNETILDQLQSEQGARFIKKRNRNIIIKVDEEIQLYPDFCWLTLGQIKEFIKTDNKVNMDTRTVIAGIPFGSYTSDIVSFFNVMNIVIDSPIKKIGQKLLQSELDSESALNSFDEIISWFTNLKSNCELDIITISLKNARNWIISDYAIYHEEQKFFKVIAIEVKISSREVQHWHQPLIEPVQQGICAFICKEIAGIIHFLVQAKLESGNFDILEMAPTVQCLTGSYTSNESLISLPFLEYVLTAKANILFDAIQSEEGGRFYREQNRNMIILADDSFKTKVPENYIWMTLNQIKAFIRFNNYLNIQARSLISAISFH